ncbi:MAG TPA: TonB-dependent receptor [Gemmatimonadaceae bacterium]|jgi:hypothetical protein
MIRAFACAVFTAATLGTVPTFAMAQHPTGVVRGFVNDESDSAVAGVEISTLDGSRVVRTDTAGHFALTGVPSGSVRLNLRRLAFEPLQLSFDLPAGDTADVEITLSVVAQKLNAVLVLADPDHLRKLEGFNSRRKLGIGHFITRADIEKQNPAVLSDIVRMIPGVRIVANNLGSSTLRFSRTERKDCPPQFFVDGVQVTNFSLDDMPPGDVEAIELYAGAAGIPPEFNRQRSNVICGAIIIWSRIPGSNASP